jgi:hypothetical protein
MKKPFVFKPYLLVLRCCLIAICLLSYAYADTNTEQQIKVSFIYNFAKFVTWPNLTSATTPLVICVMGSQPLSDKIALLQNKKVDTRSIQVFFLAQNKPSSHCNMLFISESETPRLEKILESIATLPTLTVSTIPDFVQTGGMIGLKVLNSRVRFDVNLLATQKAGLSLNSQLASLADEVIQ